MTQLFILLAQNVTGAVIFIIGLLIVAAVIGYLTAWFYAKSVYTPIIKGIEKDKADLTDRVESLSKQVESLKSEIINLNTTISAQSEKIKTLEKQIEEKNTEIKRLTKPIKEN
jgi:peptidoglycan hydrolase CwlO-like protein